MGITYFELMEIKEKMSEMAYFNEKRKLSGIFRISLFSVANPEVPRFLMAYFKFCQEKKGEDKDEEATCG